MRRLAIDPSINTVGWAVEEDTIRFGTIKVKGVDIPERIKRIVQLLDEKVEGRFDEILIEMPGPFGSYKSLGSFSSTSLFKLSFATGAIVLWATGRSDNVKLVPVATWKGQLPKHVVYERIKRDYPDVKSDHEADAIGILLWRRRNEER